MGRRVMELSEEDRKKLADELIKMDVTPCRPCRRLEQRTKYAVAWCIGFVSGMMAAKGMKN